MSKQWDKIAKQEFDAMPKTYRDDWADFRDRVM